MPVIINDFEVVAEPPPTTPTAGATPAAGSPAQSPSPAPVVTPPNPLHIVRIEEHRRLRQMRLWSH